MKILHLKHAAIDKARWDATLEVSSQAVPYAYSWYLDSVAAGWEALVTPDYSCIMPIPLKHKWGIPYVIQPRFVQQLGLFSIHEVTPQLLKAFLKAIPYWSYDFNLNFGNKSNYSPLPNAIIPLQSSIDAIRSNYSNNTKRNIKKAQTAKLLLQPVSRALFLQNWKQINSTAVPELVDKLENLTQSAQQLKKGFFFGVYNSNNQIVAVLFLIRENNRVIYLAPASTAQGKSCSAMFFMVDALLQQFAGQELIFDCEGSQIPGVARFYQGFGALPETYFTVNRLRPQWLVKLIHH